MPSTPRLNGRQHHNQRSSPRSPPAKRPAVSQRSRKRVVIVTPNESHAASSHLATQAGPMQTTLSVGDALVRAGKAQQDEILRHNHTRQLLQAQVAGRVAAERNLWYAKVQNADLVGQITRYQDTRLRQLDSNPDFARLRADLELARAANERMHAYLHSLSEATATSFRLSLEGAKDRQICVLKRRLRQASVEAQETEERASPAVRELAGVTESMEFGPWDGSTSSQTKVDTPDAGNRKEVEDVEVNGEEGARLPGDLLMGS